MTMLLRALLVEPLPREHVRYHYPSRTEAREESQYP